MGGGEVVIYFMLILTFQILSSVFGFTNKVLLFFNKRIGWVAGLLAGLFFVVYFFLIGFNVYAIVQIGFSLLMLYGYFSYKSISHSQRTLATTILSIIAIVVTVLTFKGNLTILEAVSALLASWGTYFLASKKPKKGWVSYLIAHIILIYLTFIKQQYFFVFFQFASAIVSVLAISKPKPLNNEI